MSKAILPISINSQHPGTREQLKSFISCISQKPADTKAEAPDESLLNLVKSAAGSMVDLLPEEFSHGIIKGTASVTNTGRVQIAINIDGVKTL